jgi:hypothetical protein
MVTGSPVSFVFVVVLGALVLGSVMTASGKEKMTRFESESDVSRARVVVLP